MTREEEIRTAAIRSCSPLSEWSGSTADAFVKGAQWADQHPFNQWHDASKEWPKVDEGFKYKTVIVARPDNHVHFACYSYVGFSVNESFYGEFLIDNVKYWMEIPEIPEIGKEG